MHGWKMNGKCNDMLENSHCLLCIYEWLKLNASPEIAL